MPADRFGAGGAGRRRPSFLGFPVRFFVDRRDAARARRSAAVASTALDWAALHGTREPAAVRAILKGARRDAAVLRLAESRLVRRAHADTRARDALALVQLALDELPTRLGA
jgi:hypothetical protein